MFLYYITDRKQFPGTESQRRDLLLEKIAEAASAGVDYIQLREKDLPGRELESLAREAMKLIHKSGARTSLLINSRTDIAIAAEANGVHLTSDDLSPGDVKNIWHEADGRAEPVIAISCHTEADVIAAEGAAVDFVVFGPVFGKSGAQELPPVGTDQLRKACQRRIPVIALGGVNTGNAPQCINAGASGIAGIRLFQENEIAAVVTKLRAS